MTRVGRAPVRRRRRVAPRARCRAAPPSSSTGRASPGSSTSSPARSRSPRCIETTPIPRSRRGSRERRRSARSRAASSRCPTIAATRATPISAGRTCVWNVFAAPELSLTPRQWCFPVAGCVAYRGYFAEADARAEAARLAAAGDDVHVGGVPAYSTLGYFDDPVLSTFIRYREVGARAPHLPRARAPGRLREGRHVVQRVVRGRRRGGGGRALARGGAATRSGGRRAARRRHRRAATQPRRVPRADRRDARAARARSTRGPATDADKRAGKAAVFAADARRVRAVEGGVGRRRRHSTAGSPPAPTTRASRPSGLYADRVPQFRALLDEEKGDLPRFYARVKALAALPKAERERRSLRRRRRRRAADGLEGARCPRRVSAG